MQRKYRLWFLHLLPLYRKIPVKGSFNNIIT
ncbi:hypothetical protein FOXB_05784 [Fusarium oxysporum f. sp. conglutinans Fo5176]|uniref:Uncharacterized protein n=1 Tax=Fusarium oxysporum (strain Fo5176) TaxID=660025 RepID=F9FHA5_FUSOF|nr:hypothetical protein FOXB_05784 [Fusarium oxysporum f. sp. conglutinans Fo5176]